MTDKDTQARLIALEALFEQMMQDMCKPTYERLSVQEYLERLEHARNRYPLEWEERE